MVFTFLPISYLMLGIIIINIVIMSDCLARVTVYLSSIENHALTSVEFFLLIGNSL